jgi:tetratricopeptide (TPR) repeat protein
MTHTLRTALGDVLAGSRRPATWRNVTAALAAIFAASGCQCGTSAPLPNAPVAVSAAVQLTRGADVALQAGRTAEALSMARDAAQREPRSAVAHNLAGRAAAARFAETHDVTDAAAARAAFEQALAVDPTFWPALQNLGELEEASGDTRGAAAAYRRLLEAQPDHPEQPRFAAVIARADAAAAPPRGSRRAGALAASSTAGHPRASQARQGSGNGAEGKP